MMVAMAPGNDGKEWFLCPGCYQDGLHKMNGDPNVVAADRTRGETVPAPRTNKPPDKARKPGSAARGAEPSRSAAKDDVGSFDPHPGPKTDLYYNGGIQYVPDDDGYW